MKHRMHRIAARPDAAFRQRGAALYVALIMLILLALIGIVGLQVAGMQERMAANYLRVNVAFQNAEAVVRRIEKDSGNALFSVAGTYAASQETCEPAFDATTWGNGISATEATFTRRIDRCFPASSRRIGSRRNEETGNIYEVTVLTSDDSESASAIISTVYIP